MSTVYKCSKCKLLVIVIPNNDPIKACNCNAPIIAEISSISYGISVIKN